MSAPLVIPDADTALARVEKLAALTIKDERQEKDAVDGLAFIQGFRRELDKARRGRVDPLNAEVKAINAAFKPTADAVERAEEQVKTAILTWRRQEAARIEVEQRRAREENERREQAARAEQLRLEREAQDREQAERERVARETEAAAQAAGFTPTEAAELAALESADVAPVAAPVVEAPVRAVAPAALLPTVKATLGSATVRKIWTFAIDNPIDIPRAYLIVDESALRRAVQAGVRDIPGVRIFEREQLAGRSV